MSVDYLERIVPAVQRRLAERRLRVPLEQLESLASPAGRPSFAAALGGERLALVAEVKRASPSRGPIRPDLKVADLVTAYEAAGASAISVLTEEDFFRGSMEDLRQAAEHTRLPLLCKDFVIDAYQVHGARAAGASAVLLIAALLDERRLPELAGLAVDLGLDVLVEVHDAVQMERALAVEHAVIGINNRDLTDFSVSLDTTAHLAGLVPRGRIVVSESGIRTRADLETLAVLGVDAVLVGESLLAEADVGQAIRRLVDPPLHVAVRDDGRGEGRRAG